MTDRPYRGVDPLMGTPFRMPEHKPNGALRERLAHERERPTEGGTIKTLPDGSMQFVPSRRTPLQDIAEPAAAFVPGVMVRITSCVDTLRMQDPWPMTHELAASVAGLIGVVASTSDDGSGFYVEVGGNCLLLLPTSFRALTPAELRDALPPAEGAATAPEGFADGERVRITATVDELMDLLDGASVDTAAVLGRDGKVIGDAFQGKHCVRFANDGGNKVWLLHLPASFLRRAEPAEGDDEPVVEFKHMPRDEALADLGRQYVQASELGALSLNEAQAMFYKDLLLSNEETAEVLHPYTCDLKPNDWVEVIDGKFAGMQGSVRRTYYGQPVIAMPGGNMLQTQRCNVRLVTRAGD